MNLPYELQIGWRYTRIGRSGRRNGFISFISGVSMLGVGLDIAVLTVVSSVMHGSQLTVLTPYRRWSAPHGSACVMARTTRAKCRCS